MKYKNMHRKIQTMRDEVNAKLNETTKIVLKFEELKSQNKKLT